MKVEQLLKMIDRYEQTIGFDPRQMLTYEHIALQWYCKLNNISLLCFPGDGTNMQGLEDLITRKLLIYRDLVDWDNFWLYNKTEEWQNGC